MLKQPHIAMGRVMTKENKHAIGNFLLKIKSVVYYSSLYMFSTFTCVCHTDMESHTTKEDENIFLTH